MNKSVDLILSAVKSAGEAALRLHEENKSLRERLRSEQNPGLAVRQQAADALERLTAENAALRDLSFPPFGHEFTVPTDKMDAEFLSWIRRNCLIVTEDHYTALRSRVAELEAERELIVARAENAEAALTAASTP